MSMSALTSFGELVLKGRVMSFVGDIATALIGKKSSDKALRAQTEAADNSNALLERMYNQTREDQTPYREASTSALAQIQNLLKSPDAITQDPGYKFGLDQGTRALNSGAAARGMTYSGAAGKALTRYGQDYAGTKLDQSYNRLANIANLGQVAVNGQNNQQFANNTSNNLIGLGNARAGASMYQGMLWGNAANSLVNFGVGKLFPGGGEG